MDSKYVYNFAHIYWCVLSHYVILSRWISSVYRILLLRYARSFKEMYSSTKMKNSVIYSPSCHQEDILEMVLCPHTNVVLQIIFGVLQMKGE